MQTPNFAETWDALSAPVPSTLTPVAGNIHQIKLLLRDSPEAFISFFLGDALTVPIPPFHIEVFYEATHSGVDRLAMALPRGTAKSTLCKLAVIWYFLFTDTTYILYVSGSHDLVAPYVSDIIAFMESDNFQAIFGVLDFDIPEGYRRQGQGEYVFHIPSLGKNCILRGLGSGQRVRGTLILNRRPQLAIADDLEDDLNVETERAHLQLLRWFFGAFMKCMDPLKNKIIVSGNLLAAQSILYKLLQSPRWRSFLYGILLSDGTSLWADVWPVEKIRSDYYEYEQIGIIDKWFAEMMNQPVPSGGGIIKASQINYQPARLESEIAYGFICVDPAISDKKWGDNRAIAAVGWVVEIEQWQILEIYANRQIDSVELFRQAVAMAERWRFSLIGIEAVAMQRALVQLYNLLTQLYNIQGIEFLPIEMGIQAKKHRITAFASALITEEDRPPAQFALTSGDFATTQQLLMYDPKKKENDDDIVDACAMSLKMIQMYLAKVMQSVRRDSTGDGGFTSLNQFAAI